MAVEAGRRSRDQKIRRGPSCATAEFASSLGVEHSNLNSTTTDMISSLRSPTTVHTPGLLVLAIFATQRSVVHAQYGGDPGTPNSQPPLQFWLSPGRIAGIAVGAIVLVFLLLSMLILVCRRRRRRAKATKVMVSNYSGQPQPSLPWRPQQQVQTPYGPNTTNAGWYYPTQGPAPTDQARSIVSPTPPLHQVQRPAPTAQGPRTPTVSQGQRTAPSGEVQGPPPTSQVQTTVPSGQVPSPSPAQRNVLPSQVPSIAPVGRPQSAAPSVGAREHGIPIPPPPQHAHTKGTLSAGPIDDNESPPPYYPPTAPPTPPPTHAVR
ncbi:hypothetical protein HD554DRAFT_2036464 [Boletus coccyginus]|nr:hypothetical protein HD554DRAFT_2036464 [Boletus coccyginus]